MVEKIWVCQLSALHIFGIPVFVPIFLQTGEKTEEQRAFRQIVRRLCLCAYLHVALTGIIARWRRPSSKNFLGATIIDG